MTLFFPSIFSQVNFIPIRTHILRDTASSTVNGRHYNWSHFRNAYNHKLSSYSSEFPLHSPYLLPNSLSSASHFTRILDLFQSHSPMDCPCASDHANITIVGGRWNAEEEHEEGGYCKGEEDTRRA